MMTIREAQSEEFEKIAKFYRANGYRSDIGQNDVFMMVEDVGALLGVARLCEEDNVLVLRGMQVAKGMSGKGIGTALLNSIAPVVGERTCFCVPYRNLVSFYSQIGFVEIDVSESPAFLRARSEEYKRRFDLDVVIMRRPGSRRVNQEVEGSAT